MAGWDSNPPASSAGVWGRIAALATKFQDFEVDVHSSSIIYCLPPCGSVPLYGDTLHLGTLILGPLAAYFAYRAMRRSSSVRGSWLAMAGNVVIMVALLVAILAVLAWLANTAGGF